MNGELGVITLRVPSQAFRVGDFKVASWLSIGGEHAAGHSGPAV